MSRQSREGSEPQSGDILTIRQLSEYLMVSEKTIYRMLDRGTLPAVRVGAQWRFRKRDIDGWLDEQVRRVDVEGPRALLADLAPSEIDIHPLLSPQNVWVDVPQQPRDELLAFMVKNADVDPGVDRQALYDSIRQREAVCSTALVKDAAFPHPNEPASFRFSRKRILLAVSSEPVEFFDPHDHRPRVVAVILARTVQGYLLTISRAVKLFGSPALVDRVVACRDAGSVIETIREAEARLRAPAPR